MNKLSNEPRPDILDHVRKAAKFIDFDGARVLEIGGDRWDAAAGYMVDRGAASVTIINIAPHWKDFEQLTPQISKVRGSATELTQHFPLDHFDAVFGVAILEHIPLQWLMLSELKQVLVGGGKAYLHGAPIWTSHKGHHLFTRVGDRHYRFADSDCPVGDWEHLYLDRTEMAERIVDRGHDRETAATLAEWVHSTEGQNRYGTRRIDRIFRSSPLDVVECQHSRGKRPNTDVLKRIAGGPWGDEDDFETFGLTYFLENGLGPGEDAAAGRRRRFRVWR